MHRTHARTAAHNSPPHVGAGLNYEAHSPPVPNPPPPDWSLACELSSRVSLATLIRENEPLAKRTTLRVGGVADVFVEVASERDLLETLQFCGQRHIPFLVMGRGSNLLIRDGGIRGMVICLSQDYFGQVKVEGEFLDCGAAARLKAVAMTARRHGLEHFEFLEGIPGSIGGGLRMNAGAMGSALFDIVHSVRMVDFNGRVLEKQVGELQVLYRQCPAFKNHIAVGARLRGKQGSSELIEARLKEYREKRWESQPAAPSAGCIFKNPCSITAGKLIDELGLKGTRIGGARVSEEHGNFIVNDGTARASEVLELIERIRACARAARGIELETEVEIVGE